MVEEEEEFMVDCCLLFSLLVKFVDIVIVCVCVRVCKCAFMCVVVPDKYQEQYFYLKKMWHKTWQSGFYFA